MKFTIPGSLPSLNEYINAERANRFAAASMKKKAEEKITLAIRSQLKGFKAKEPVYIRYTWIDANKRKDHDNVAFAKKFIQDALVRAGVLTNDGWTNICGFEDHFACEPSKPRVIVEIVEDDRFD